MPNILIAKSDTRLSGEIVLPGSKSESNRALIMQALSGEYITIRNLSEAADTVTLGQLLQGRGTSKTLDVGPAGTAMRFLTAFCAVSEGEEWILTGSKRMKERPIGILADALRELGADITYLEEDGFPPMKIKGKRLEKTDKVTVPGNISSQYISALLMIAPVLPSGLTIRLSGEIASRPYIEMTLAMMAELGIKHTWNGNSIHVAAQPYRRGTLTIEPDWSGASYWYSMAAICDEVDLQLPYLKQNSLQGDRAIARIMKNFGVDSRFSDRGVHLSRSQASPETSGNEDALDFIHCPDLAQTVISCCVGLRQPAAFTGLESLKIKETDRVEALRSELGKFGARLAENAAGNRWELDTSAVRQPDTPPLIRTYHDHRMAMAIAPLAITLGPLQIEDKDVVAKSYPGFWDDLQQQGFELKTPQIIL